MFLTARMAAPVFLSLTLLTLAACEGDEGRPRSSSRAIDPASPYSARTATPAEPSGQARAESIPSLSHAIAYEIMSRETAANNSERVWIYADLEKAASKAVRAETALRAAQDVLKRGDAARVEVILLPAAYKGLAGIGVGLANAQIDPTFGIWGVSAVEGDVDEFVLLALDILGGNIELFLDENGEFRADAFATYLARVLAISPREAQNLLREARQMSSSRSEYWP